MYLRAVAAHSCGCCLPHTRRTRSLASTINAFLDRTSCWTIERATAHGDARLLRRVIDDNRRDGSQRIRDVHYIAHVVRKAFVLAVRHDNDVDLLECLVRAAPALQSRVSATLGAQEAAALGKVRVLQWFKDHCRNVAWGRDAVNRAASAGHIDVLEWLKHNAVVYWHCVPRHAIQHAVSSGQLAALEWLQTEVEAQRDLPRPDPVIEAAIGHGLLSIVQFLHGRGYKLTHGPSMDFAMRAPVDATFVQWLAANGYAGYCKHAFALAAGAGDLDTAQWLLANAQELSEVHFHSAAKLAAASGHVKVLEFLRDQCSVRIDGEVLACAADHGHFAAVQWIQHNMHASAYSFGSLSTEDAAVNVAAANGHFEIAECIHVHRGNPEYTNYRVDAVAAGGNLSSVQWIVAHMPERYGAGAAARAVCQTGDLDTLQWLYERSGFEITCGRSHLMDVAAEHGHLRILQWLHDAGIDRCTTHAMDWAAANGHLDVVEWLHAHTTEGCSREAMSRAAANGHFEVLLFLHSHRREGYDTSILSDPFYCEQMDIVWWICDHCPDVLASTGVKWFLKRQGSHIEQLRRGELVW